MSPYIYPYSHGDRLNDRNTYFYSEYHGPAFLEAWHASRSAALAALPAALPPQLPAARAGQATEGYNTAELLTHLLQEQSKQSEHQPLLDRLLQRFEVSKRLYRQYDADFKAIRDSGYDDLNLYILFAAVCVDSQKRPAAMRFLNALLKALDSLISARERLEPEQGARLAWLIEKERAWVQRLAADVGVAVLP
jgi:hypothetical protein